MDAIRVYKIKAISAHQFSIGVGQNYIGMQVLFSFISPYPSYLISSAHLLRVYKVDMNNQRAHINLISLMDLSLSYTFLPSTPLARYLWRNTLPNRP